MKGLQMWILRDSLMGQISKNVLSQEDCWNGPAKYEEIRIV